MADPLVQKINLIPVQTDAVEAADEAIMNDVSEADLTKYTKRVRFDAIKLFVATQLADGIVVNSKIANGAVTLGKLAAEVTAAMNLDQIYIQLFPETEIITTVSGKSSLFVTSYLAGKKIKKVGLGVKTAGSGNTTVALSTYASVAGNGYAEGADIDVALPGVGTKIPINVTAGAGSPKGLDFWITVG